MSVFKKNYMENSFPGEGTCLGIHVVYSAEEVGNFPTLGDGNAKLTMVSGIS